MERSTTWKRLERPNSLLLASELAAATSSSTLEFAKLATYQRLSHSMRLSDEYSGGSSTRGRHTASAWSTYLGKVFSFKKMGGSNGREQVIEADDQAAAAATTKKKRSSWLPDPDRRWPVQGW
ncbi:hypothetical protein ACH5RR_011759 [Cinchona calisaya]|uniref:Uncharacterized protein n=1 Tax=Cinchona calisaya TaxID=153742 RepID=A0ABD3ABQ5_9GENT